MSKSALLESKLLSSGFTSILGKDRSNKGTNLSWHSKIQWSAWEAISDKLNSSNQATNAEVFGFLRSWKDSL